MKSSNIFRSFALVLGIAAGQFSLQVAHAHAALQQSTPAANSVVVSPNEIDLVFNETLLSRASRLELLMVHGNSTMPIKNVTTEIVNDGKTLRAKLPKPLAAGMYRVEYRAVGGDNHPMTGSFSFTVR
ncbi:copper homeostasis periplasmic binding protein CopC [Stenotrophomonas sp. Ste96]|uniref:copper homeostasis periplasmic binding protein CopC n=1 Tax=Stenotrophomonas sp. Ste96 TaxID=2926029 RepID=UPI0021C9AF04|nr:copper homeostasis periplasmic binding protein CopC [Stenotrophomonas sp. Ste96]